MRTAHVKVRYRGSFLIFGKDGLEKAAQVLQDAVSHTIGETVLPPENVGVELVQAGDNDHMIKDLEVTVTTTALFAGVGAVAERYASQIAKTFFEEMVGIGVNTTAIFTILVPIEMESQAIP